MTDELDELRLRIAKASGWKWIDWKGGNKALYKDGCYVGAWSDNGIVSLTPEFPDWPRDIAAAWELVEEMNTSGDGLVNLIYAIHSNKGLEWLCEFRMFAHWVLAQKKDPLSGQNDYILGYAKNVAVAICNAYLAWKEADHEHE